MKVHVLRLVPGNDIRLTLEAFVKEKKLKAAIVLSAVGSLTKASLRFANQSSSKTLSGYFEILSLSGTLSSTAGSHLHMSISDGDGIAMGGHLTTGSIVYTTLEIAIGELNDVEFSREIDPSTGFKELKVVSTN
jgi:predicted DNA-binding protein with PD1-like motif